MQILQINEIRKSYFLEAFGRTPEEMLIVSMGGCNYNCPYCKRDGQFKDNHGNIAMSYNMAMSEILSIIDTHIACGHKIRLSGGDPCMFFAQSVQIAQYCWNKHHQKISVAHNGSSPALISALLPYLDYAAIDYKGATPADIARRSNTPINPHSIDNILHILSMCQDAGILIDVRTVIFGNTLLRNLDNIATNIRQYHNVFWTLRKYNNVDGCDFIPATQNIRALADYLHSAYGILVGYRDKWNHCNFYIAA